MARGTTKKQVAAKSLEQTLWDAADKIDALRQWRG
jgi:hypothetical protein